MNNKRCCCVVRSDDYWSTAAAADFVTGSLKGVHRKDVIHILELSELHLLCFRGGCASGELNRL